MSLETRFDILGLPHLADRVASSESVLVNDEAFDADLSIEEVTALYIYKQPKDFGIMNLAEQAGVAWSPSELAQPSCDRTQRLWKLNQTVQRLQKSVGKGADWVGLYRATDGSDGVRALLKEAYVGSDSRALFPLTEEFATGSNNSSCAMTRKAKIVEDTMDMREDEPYYE
eukprot:TRINITY_DN40760_c0_g1_i1.p1 TRINITY_DN40760_c0_g1~~TRINITY_DN40760_c0_g1_i1.p1  ORF type:complete len:187 (-),score=32.08 TRINITY_DN40760_c0_g1_i1:567-1079(-)